MFASRLFGAVIAWLLAAAAVACAAGEDASKSRPNVLLLLADDQRPDTIAALGNAVIQTPNLARLVRGGAAFTRAICP